MKKQLEYKYYEIVTDHNNAKITILVGGIKSKNPKAYMDLVVSEYLKKKGNPLHNQFVEIHLDNPWLRIIIVGINDIIDNAKDGIFEVE